jgi:hypothetical protein
MIIEIEQEHGKAFLKEDNVMCKKIGIHYFIQVQFEPKSNDDQIVIGSDTNETLTCIRGETQMSTVRFKIKGNFDILSYTHNSNWFEGILFNRKALKNIDKHDKNEYHVKFFKTLKRSK